MKFSLPSNRNENFEYDGILYFAQRLEEMLFDYSVDLYRMPLLNTHGLLYEYCNIYAKVEFEGVKEYQRNIVFDELLESLKKDIVLKECWGYENIEKIVKTFGSSSPKEKYNTISYLVATFGNGRYYDCCAKTIIKYINQGKQKKKLEAAIRCFVPELISMGYDPHYVYSELRKNFFQNTIIDKNSVYKFLNIFNFKVHNYSVYFSVSSVALKFKDILQNRLSLNFEDDGNFKFFKKDSNKIIVYFDNIKALCPNTSAKIAYKRLDLFFSFYKFVGDKRSFSIQKKAMVMENDVKNPAFVDAQRTSYNISKDIDFKTIGTISDRLLTGLLSNAESEYSLLSKSIELHNTALSIPDLKSGFLNLWSAVEVLCQDKNATSKLDAVLKIVIPILKKDYLTSIVNDIRDCLQNNISEQDYNSFIEQVSETESEKKKWFYLMLKPEYCNLRKEIVDKLENYPVLRSRFLMFEDIKTTKDLKQFIDRYVQRVTWHLYRMYRARNAIIHSGEVPHNLRYLGEHLHSYVDSTLTEFIVKLSGNIPFESVNDVIVDIRFAIDNLDNVMEKNVNINDKIINVLVHPEIGCVID